MTSGDDESAAVDEAVRARDLRTPAGDGATLVDPPFASAGDVLSKNARRLAAACEIHGRPLAELRAVARGELLAAAAAATRQYADVPEPRGDGPLFVAGHQPGLFHAGVWFKNVVLARLAAAQGGVAVNLQIDGDTVKSSSVRVPTGSIDEPVAASVEFDAPAAEIPWEERTIADPAVFESFGRRAGAAVAPFVADPLLQTFWPRAVARRRETDNLGACLAQARHQWELDLGLGTYELPHGCVVGMSAQRWLLADLLVRAPQLRAVHNEALAEYRARHHVRSANHPVSQLASDDGWNEAPLWVWTADEPRRRRVFVRCTAGGMRLTDRGALDVELPCPAGGRLEPAVERLGEIAASGIKIRTRALLTTLWARLLLADAFIHGIGGGKYDRLTDDLIRRFYGLAPPEFFVVSATLQLPIERPRATAEELRLQDRRLRDLAYHPERVGDEVAGLAERALAAEKARWVAMQPTRETARTRCHAIRRLNESLSAARAREREKIVAERQRLQRRIRAESVLGSREYAFCLFPEGKLRHFLLEIPPAPP